MKAIPLLIVALLLTISHSIVAIEAMEPLKEMMPYHNTEVEECESAPEVESKLSSNEKSEYNYELERYFKCRLDNRPYTTPYPPDHTMVPPINNLCPNGYDKVMTTNPKRGPTCCARPFAVSRDPRDPLCEHVPYPLAIYPCDINGPLNGINDSSRADVNLCASQCSTNVCNAVKLGVVNNSRWSKDNRFKACAQCCLANLQGNIKPFPADITNIHVSYCVAQCETMVTAEIAALRCSPPK